MTLVSTPWRTTLRMTLMTLISMLIWICYQMRIHPASPVNFLEPTKRFGLHVVLLKWTTLSFTVTTRLVVFIFLQL
ncbi:hypothetical protein BC829DRAFT_399202 [Chytridium lagenaria]|nr:hypothetical protein BC829DRAFT_399202 [Chytridium lagenaria]